MLECGLTPDQVTYHLSHRSAHLHYGILKAWWEVELIVISIVCPQKKCFWEKWVQLLELVQNHGTSILSQALWDKWRYIATGWVQVRYFLRGTSFKRGQGTDELSKIASKMKLTRANSHVRKLCELLKKERQLMSKTGREHVDPSVCL